VIVDVEAMPACTSPTANIESAFAGEQVSVWHREIGRKVHAQTQL
jgi:hypothetical protein